MEPKVIVIVGPTCSGKTALSLEIAKKLDSEIISADSRQIYKYLNIGTAKPSDEELFTVKHHFIDLLKPDQNYNVNQFENESLEIIKKVNKKNKTPIVAGGSGLYIKAIIDGIAESADTNEEIRKELLEKKNQLGEEYIYEELKKIDPKSAAAMLPQNWKRVIRALEVYKITGKPIWEHHREQKMKKRKTQITFFQFGLLWEREFLYKNIEHRVDKMIESGLIDEVKNILSMNYNKELNSLNTVGYKEIISYLDGEISLDRAVELMKRNTRRFAKRQMTWFNGDKRINWFKMNSSTNLSEKAEKIIKVLNKSSK